MDAGILWPSIQCQRSIVCAKSPPLGAHPMATLTIPRAGTISPIFQLHWREGNYTKYVD